MAYYPAYYRALFKLLYNNRKKLYNNTADDDVGDDDDENNNVDNNSEPQTKKAKKISDKSVDQTPASKEVTLLTALKIREHFREVWTADGDTLGQLFFSLNGTQLKYATDLFFLDVIPVTPTRFRPVRCVLLFHDYMCIFHLRAEKGCK